MEIEDSPLHAKTIGLELTMARAHVGEGVACVLRVIG